MTEVVNKLVILKVVKVKVRLLYTGHAFHMFSKSRTPPFQNVAYGPDCYEELYYNVIM